MRATFLSLSAAIAMAAGFSHSSVATADSIFDSHDVDKFDAPFHLGLMGSAFTLMQPGTFAYDAQTGLAQYNAVSGSNEAGFEISLSLSIIDHAPRCYQGNCNSAWYQNNGVDPDNDWIMLGVQDQSANTIVGFGDYAGLVLNVLGDKFFQFGMGAGGHHVTPEGMAFSGWFSLVDADTGGVMGSGDVNANLAPIPVPAPLMLLGSALIGLLGMRRQAQA